MLCTPRPGATCDFHHTMFALGKGVHNFHQLRCSPLPGAIFYLYVRRGIQNQGGQFCQTKKRVVSFVKIVLKVVRNLKEPVLPISYTFSWSPCPIPTYIIHWDGGSIRLSRAELLNIKPVSNARVRQVIYILSSPFPN